MTVKCITMHYKMILHNTSGMGKIQWTQQQIILLGQYGKIYA